MADLSGSSCSRSFLFVSSVHSSLKSLPPLSQAPHIRYVSLSASFVRFHTATAADPTLNDNIIHYTELCLKPGYWEIGLGQISNL